MVLIIRENIIKNIVFMSLVALSSCGTPEEKANATAAEIFLSKDETLEKNISNIDHCIAEAERKFPIKISSYKVGPYFTPVNTTCTSYGNSVSCRSTGGYVEEHSKEYDSNFEKAKKSYAICMKNKGAKKERVKFCQRADKGEYCYDLINLRRKKDTWAGSVKEFGYIYVIKRYYDDSSMDGFRGLDGVGVKLRVK